LFRRRPSDVVESVTSRGSRALAPQSRLQSCGIHGTDVAQRWHGISPQLEVLVFTASMHRNVVITAVICLVSWSAARAQQPASVAQQPASVQKSQEERRTVGTVEAVGQASIVLRLDPGSFMVFTVDRDTIRPKTLTKGARVSVVTLTSDTEPAPTALGIDVLPSPQGLAPATAEAAAEDPVPLQVRRLESQIEHGARKYRAGLMIGAALDPELISLAGSATMGPFFTRDFQFRPSLEFAFGELTTLFGIHLDAIYTLPGMPRSIRWSPYLGIGPSFAFSHRNFEEERVDGTQVDRFDFGDFSWNNGLNFIVGARSPKGVFFELKATAYGISKVRLMGGFEF
jgi:hypothetical protein